MKNIVLIIVIAALIFGGVMLLEKRKQEVADVPTPEPAMIQVKVVSASTERLEQTRPFLAKLSSRVVAAMSSKLIGRIKEVLVKENQKIKEGDLLVQIDDRGIVSSIEAQKMTMKAQKKDAKYAKNLHERNHTLFKSGGLAQEEFEASGVAYTMKQADVEETKQKIIELEVQLSYLHIRAPFDGIIGTIVAHEGNLATPGESILTINSLDQKLTFSYVPGTKVIKIEQEVFLEGKQIGEIINLYSDADNGLSVAEVDLDNPLSLPNNAYITINVLTFAQSGCQIPLNGLILTNKGTQLMSYENEKFSPFAVTIIAGNKTHALIEPCPAVPIAVGAAAKLSSLPSRGQVLLSGSVSSEK